MGYFIALVAPNSSLFFGGCKKNTTPLNNGGVASPTIGLDPLQLPLLPPVSSLIPELRDLLLLARDVHVTPSLYCPCPLAASRPCSGGLRSCPPAPMLLVFVIEMSLM